MGIVRLLGHRIAYSASPAMHAAAFLALGLPHRYRLTDVPPEGLPGAVASLRSPDSLGANVTTPHKAAMAALTDELLPAARAAGAVNTVIRRGDRLIGDNTDLPAIVDEVRRLVPGGAARALVLGGGGASRSVELALEGAGVRTWVRVVRHPSGADRPWADLSALLRDADLVINATPIGTVADETPIPAGALRADLAVLDLVYRPSPTRLVREARAAGASARAGAGVLLGQGRRSLEAWLGCPAPINAMRDALRAELGDAADV